MTLSFSTNASGWEEATATVNADFCLHLERAKAGTYEIWVSTVQNGKYEKIVGEWSGANVDRDYDSRIYPKYIKILSQSQVTSGSIIEVGG